MVLNILSITIFSTYSSIRQMISKTVFLKACCSSSCAGLSFVESTSIGVYKNKRIRVNSVFKGIADLEYLQWNSFTALSFIWWMAWWKIQKWKIFSGFSVMGGTHDKRWFDTDVPRINWRVLSDYLITG